LHFDAKTEILFIGCSNGTLHAIDTRTRVELKAWSLDSNGLFDIKSDETRNRVLVCGGNGVLTVIEAETLEVLRSIPLSDAKLRRIAVRGESDLVAVADNAGLVHVLDAESYQTIETIHAHDEGSTAVAWHPSKPVLVTGGKDAHIRCWNMNDGYEQVLYLAAHQSTIYDIVYHAQQNCFVSCSRDKTIKWWDPNLFDPLSKVDYSEGGHKHSVNRLLVLGDRLVSAGDDRNVLVFGV
jgi:WD40 repeat protein